jgi:hypothetical protein
METCTNEFPDGYDANGANGITSSRII